MKSKFDSKLAAVLTLKGRIDYFLKFTSKKTW